MRLKLATLLSVASILLVSHPSLVVAQSGQNSAEADVLDTQIQTAFKKRDYPSLVDLIGQRRALGGHFPPPLWYVDAVAYYHLGQKSAALTALNNYFAQADHSQYPYKQSVVLAAKIRDEIASQSRSELNFRWSGAIRGTGGRVVVADVNLSGQKVREEGFTVSCTYDALPAQSANVTFEASDEPTAVDQGKEVAQSGFWQPTQVVFTVHLPIRGMPPGLSGYNGPPWYGSYDFASQKWGYVVLSGHTLRLSSYSQTGEQVAIGQYENEEVRAFFDYDAALSLDDFTWLGQIKWEVDGDLCTGDSYYGLCQGLVFGLLQGVKATDVTGLGIQSLAGDEIKPYTSGTALAKSPCEVVAYRQPPST
jgi:hypothetical protein